MCRARGSGARARDSGTARGTSRPTAFGGCSASWNWRGWPADTKRRMDHGPRTALIQSRDNHHEGEGAMPRKKTADPKKVQSDRFAQDLALYRTDPGEGIGDGEDARCTTTGGEVTSAGSEGQQHRRWWQHGHQQPTPKT